MQITGQCPHCGRILIIEEEDIGIEDEIVHIYKVCPYCNMIIDSLLD